VTVKNKNKAILILGCVGILFGLAGYVFPKRVSDLPPRIYFDTVGGPVIFTHQTHTDPSQFKCGSHLNVSKIHCADCHHEMIQANHVFSCKKCHPGEDYSKESMSHSELLEMHPPGCTLCHSPRPGRVKPCKACHLPKGEPKPVSCDNCHSGEGYSAKDFTHEELEETEGHWCTECHSVRRKGDAIHMRCNQCHKDLECGTYIKKKDPDDEAFVCALCHLKSGPL